jgi:GntR family transcriptional regulator
VHKHVEVREHLRALLSTEPPGTAAPSERALAEQFGVARMTVRQAIDALVVDGLLERAQGRGTFVSRGRGDIASRFTSYTEEMLRRGLRPESRTLRLREDRPPPAVAGALELDPTANVVQWTRIRYADGITMCLEDAFLPSVLVPELIEGSQPESLYVDLAGRGLTPTRVEDAIDAGVAGPEEAEVLGIEVGAPVLRISRRTFAGPRPVEVSRSTYRADRFTLRLALTRGGN